MTSIANRYQILSELGKGGMGTVYSATDLLTKTTVAVKHLKPELTSPELIERFRREGEALRELNHPNIVKMLDSVEEDGNYYLVIEYLSGGDLNGLLKQGNLAVKKVLQLAIDICDALTRAHKLDIIHRDLKPANVLIADDGSLRLSDFGVAYIGQKQRVTATDMIVGTVDYLAPETLDGRGIDSRADIWAFGVMLFEMLSGQRPFRGESVTQTLYAIASQAVPDLEVLRPDAPVALIDLIYRMLEKDPQQRVPSVRYAGAELETILHEKQPVSKTPAQSIRSSAPSATTAIRHNLPMQLTNFVGRLNELAVLSQLLKQDNVRLITIVAQGGMGKSRLALEAAQQNLDTFTDGVFFVELAPLSEPESIVQVLIDAIRCPFVPDEKRSRSQQLVEFLNDKHMLLVMDNFEHLISGANIVSEILAATTGVRILVTSRQHLNQSNEHLVQLKAMPYPDWQSPEDAMNYDAFQLFMQSARRLQPDFELTQDNLDKVTRICQGVQGLPLGIILAASWLSMLTLDEIVIEMQGSFDFLVSDMADLPERQRSMRQVFEYSWRLMSEKEQQTLMALSVFRGGFTRDAAAVVCQAGLRDLMGFVNKSLISRDSASGRYNIHELLRQYAAEHLKQSEQENAILDAHKRYFAAWMLAREGEITYRRQQAALNDIEVDFENLRLGWDTAVEQRDFSSLNQMVEALHLFTEMRIRHDEGYKMLQSALEITSTSERLYHRLLFRMIRLARFGGFGDYESSLSKIKQGQLQAQLHKDNEELGLATFIEMTIRDTEDTNELAEKALSLLTTATFYYSHVLKAWTRSLNPPSYVTCKTLLLDALKLQRERGDVNEIAWTLATIVELCSSHMDFGEGEKYIEEALRYSQLIRHPHCESAILNNAAQISFQKGELEKSLELTERSFNLASQISPGVSQLFACGLMLTIKHLLHEPTGELRTRAIKIIEKGRETFPWWEKVWDYTVLGACNHSFSGNDAAARHAWQSSQFAISPVEWTEIFAIEAVSLATSGEHEFAATLIGHLGTYADDVVGWLKRWSRYQETLKVLQSRLDEALYKTAFARGQILTLDEMVEALKTDTRHP